jgi:predicted amidohydrolase YtcJ
MTLRHQIGAALTLALLTACAGTTPDGGRAVPENDTWFLTNATVVTGTGGSTPNSTVEIRGNRIVSVGATPPAGARTIDLHGHSILPGLIDAHGHVAGLGDALATVQLEETASFDEVGAKIREGAAKITGDDWVTGRGWDQNDWAEKEFPTASMLDRYVSERPVFVRRVDGHAALANTAAIRAAGITRQTADPDGGKILRDANGEPTGVFIDNAMDLIERVIPPLSREARKARLVMAAQKIASEGLVEVHDAGVDDTTIALMQELIDEGAFPIRVYAMLSDNATLLDKWFRRGPLIRHGDKLTVRSVKMYSDGALGSRGAAMVAPYTDDPKNAGLLLTTKEHIEDVARRAIASRFQVNAHAIGDRGARVVLDAYRDAGVRPEHRFRIEHLQVVDVDDLVPMVRMGVIASMQPTHATSDMYWAEQRVGPERVKGAYAWRKVLDAGGRLALGSDFPVEAVNPFFGLFAAETRMDQKLWPAGGWYPEEKLTRSEALRGFTSDAAFSAFEEDDRGVIAPGKLADLTIIEGNWDELPADDLFKTKVRMTVVGGEIVYEKR